MPLVLAHEICKRLDAARKQGTITGIFSDGKAQVSVRYNDAGKPQAVETVVVSVQHDKSKDFDELRREITSMIIGPACSSYLPVDENTTILVNPSGRFVEGGPKADTGLTGRKLMVDTYGGFAGHGGGAFSGKLCNLLSKGWTCRICNELSNYIIPFILLLENNYEMI